jgi:ribosomal-protein-alanine N-acetyltransferase
MNANYTLRYMRLDDIAPVTEIDKLSFPTPWAPRSYAFEVAENKAGHMILLEETPSATSGKGLLHIIQRLSGQPTPATIAGYGGFWLIDGELHVSTIAVHPDYRGRGLGEVLLAGMLSRGMALKADYSVLEVRVSNQRALNLYYKYEYKIVSQRKNYYRDNNEDAYLMQLDALDEAYKSRFAERINRLCERVPYSDLLGH